MKMKDQLDSAQPMKKHKTKSKKADLKKKKRAKLEAKKQSKEKKQANLAPLPTPAEKVEKVEKPSKVKEPTTAKEITTTSTAPSIAEPPVSNTTQPITNTTDTQTVRTRASKSLTPMTKAQQRVAINKIIKSLILDEITQGAALRELRVSVLGLKQEAYTELTGVSRKTLSEIENDKGNYTPETINKVFKPFELKMALMPTSSSTLKTLLR